MESKEIVEFFIDLNSKGISIHGFQENIKVKGDIKNLTPEDKTKIKFNKDKLLAFLNRKLITKESDKRIPNVDIKEDYPLSSSQLRMWISCQFPESNKSYNMPAVFSMTGGLSINILEKAVRYLLKRHEILRTVYVKNKNHELRQRILKEEEDFEFHLSEEDFSKSSNKEKLLSEAILKNQTQEFDLEKAPLVRFGLYKILKDKWILSFTVHHIACDGWSQEIFMNELILVYFKLFKEQKDLLSDLKIQYKDYAVWQQSNISGDQLNSSKSYWLNKFSESVPVLNLPSEKVRPAIKTFRGGRVSKTFSKDQMDSVLDIFNAEKCTLFVGLSSLLYTFLYRYTNQTDITIGTPVAGRNLLELENQIGYYSNTLALRTSFSSDMSFIKLLQVTKDNITEAFNYQDYPFDSLVGELKHENDLSRNPLFDVMINVESNENNVLKEKLDLGFEIEVLNNKLKHNSSLFDLTFDFYENEDNLELSLEYSSDIFTEESIKELVEHFDCLLNSVIHSPQKSIKYLNILPKEERNKLVLDFNDTDIPFSSNVSFVDLFESQVVKTSDKTAIIYEDVSISYKELNEISNQLSRFLINQYDIKSNDIIGISLERNHYFIIAILAVLKTGGAYVPIDPSLPKKRKEYILNDSKSRITITSELFEIFLESKKAFDKNNIGLKIPSDNLAYIIYTSGTTGKPKGTMNEHLGMINHMYAMVDFLKLDQSSIIAHTAPFSFDISVWQALNLFIVGGTIVIYNDQRIKTPSLFIEGINKWKISIIQLVPSFLNVLYDYVKLSNINDLKTLSKIIVTGEKVNKLTINKHFELFENISLINAYGPAEASDDVTLYEFDKTINTNYIPIGKPIRNMKIYILDENMMLCPLGHKGEIFISGIGVGKGYVNNIDLNEKSFLLDPFQKNKKTKMYKTGDHGKWLPDGNLVFLDRKDSQVKIRGYRMELGEIENSINSYPLIESSAVIVKNDASHRKELVAYLFGHRKINIQQLKEELLNSLPFYMVPKYIFQIEALPLTPNGKIDKKILAKLELKGNNKRKVIEPRNEVDDVLIGFWIDIFKNVENISIEDNFFEIGGTSIDLIKLNIEICNYFDQNLPLPILYEYPTILGLSGYISNNTVSIKKDHQVIDSKTIEFDEFSNLEENEVYNLSDNQLLEVYAEDVFPIILEDIVPEFELNIFKESIKYLIKRHEILRTRFIREENIIKQKTILIQEFELSITFHNGPHDKDDIAIFLKEEEKNCFNITDICRFKVNIFNINNDKAHVIISLDHSICDGFSIGIIKSELSEIYYSLKNDISIKLPKLNCQYRDYVWWQKNHINSKVGINSKRHWENIVNNLTSPLQGYDIDYLNLKMQEVLIMNRTIDATLLENLSEFASKEHVTLQVLFLSVFSLTINEVFDENNFAIKTQSSGRFSKYFGDKDFDQLVGLFSNSVLFKPMIDKNDSMVSFIKKSMKSFINNLAHSDFPLSKLTAFSNKSDLINFPLLYNYIDYNYLKNIKLQIEEIEEIAYINTEFNKIVLSATVYSDQVHVKFLFDNTIFDKELRSRFCSTYFKILNNVSSEKYLINETVKV